MTLRSGIICTSLALSLLACSDQSGPEQSNTVTANQLIASEKLPFKIDILTDKLEIPWGIAFLPDGRILVTEKKGEIRIVKEGKLLDEKIANVPAVYNHGQGDLMDISVHPDYAKNGWIYLSYAKPGEGGGGTTIARTKLQGNAFTDFQELFMVLGAFHCMVLGAFHCNVRYDAGHKRFISQLEE